MNEAKNAMGASDVQRQNMRTMMEVAGCFECKHLVTVRGRNCNDYKCAFLPTCEKMHIVRIAAKRIEERDA